MSAIVLWLVTSLLFFFGLLGTLVPAIPGLGLIIAGILFYAIVTGFSTISVLTVILLCTIAALTFIASYFTSAVGARISGGGRYAVLGTLAGAIIGFMTLGPFGLLLGAAIGAFAGALYESRSLEKSARITIASLIGFFGGAVMQFLVGFGIISAFLIAVLA